MVAVRTGKCDTCNSLFCNSQTQFLRIAQAVLADRTRAVLHLQANTADQELLFFPVFWSGNIFQRSDEPLVADLHRLLNPFFLQCCLQCFVCGIAIEKHDVLGITAKARSGRPLVRFSPVSDSVHIQPNIARNFKPHPIGQKAIGGIFSKLFLLPLVKLLLQKRQSPHTLAPAAGHRLWVSRICRPAHSEPARFGPDISPCISKL